MTTRYPEVPLPDITQTGITLESARAELQVWLQCSRAIAKNQSYRVGDLEYRRADLDAVMRMITFWQGVLTDPTLAGSTRSNLPRTRVLRGYC